MGRKGKIDIWVYAHWKGLKTPNLIGILAAHQAKGRKAFSFTYDPEWLGSGDQVLLDPDIQWYSGPQFPSKTENFGLFLDSMPDRWGRTLLNKRSAEIAKEVGAPHPNLYDIDFLLGVNDETRMGALRFKGSPDGPFLDDNPLTPIPPLASVRELQYAAEVIESDSDSKEVKKWLSILLAPGSSLGGARPKANIKDENGNLWIAKFPSGKDEYDKGKWEYLAYKLALKAGIPMAESRILKVSGKHHTFLTKRFDRMGRERIHFASAMTMTQHNEDTLKDHTPSYLELAEFIQFSGASPLADLHQLWRRLVFNIALSNTDDHLRNHGFLLTDKGWRLSPAYDINPSTEKDGLSLNIDTDHNNLDVKLAMEVGEYFQLGPKEMDEIWDQVQKVIASWRQIADQIGISRREKERLAPAFKLTWTG